MVKHGIEFIKKAGRIIVLKPQRILPHVKTRFMSVFWKLLCGRAAFPHTIYIGITKNCNLKCRMCDLGQKSGTSYGRFLSPESDLPFFVWKKFIDEIAKFGPAIELCAAEPLLYKDFMSMVKYIKQKKLTCRIFTNGFLLEEYAHLIEKEGVDYLFVSLDGPGKIHDDIRGCPGLFEKVVNGLKKLKTNGKTNPAIDINYTVTHHNYASIEPTVNVLMDRGVKFDRFTVMLTLFATKATADRHNRLYPEFPVEPICENGVDFSVIDINVVKEQIERLRKKYPGKVRLYPEVNTAYIQDWYRNPNKFVGNNKCRFIWNSANITSDGGVITNFRCVSRSFGNINREKFKKIWNCRDFRKFRLLSAKSGPLPICARCSASFSK